MISPNDSERAVIPCLRLVQAVSRVTAAGRSWQRAVYAASVGSPLLGWSVVGLSPLLGAPVAFACGRQPVVSPSTKHRTKDQKKGGAV